MSGYKPRNLQIEHQCPQCGGPVVLDETDRLFSCEFCRVKLYIVSKNWFRYYLSHSVPESEEILFVPYWRFRGMYFSMRPFEIKNKVLDNSFIAADHRFLPVSLGLRTQALKLRFASPEMKVNFLEPKLSFMDVIARIEGQSHFIDGGSGAGQVFHKAFIGETVSMIYSPLYIKNRALYDAVLKKPVAQYTSIREDELQDFDKQRNWELKFLSALCPDCGWDLAGAKDSLVLLCKNCDTGWQIFEGNFQKLPFGIAQGTNKNVFYIPFWRMKVKVDGLKLNSYADLIKIGNLPKAVKKEWSENEMYFWSPAFKAHPKVFMRLALQVTGFQPQDRFSDTLPKCALHPVTLNVQEAFQSVKVTIANIGVPKKKILPLLSQVNTELEERLLVYFPFAVGSSEFIQSQMKFSIQKSTIRV